MEFDNKQFEKGVSTTINSIDELKKSLEFKGVEKGFDNVTKGFAGIGIEKVGSALDAVTSKFSIFGTVGDQVIRNLTNSLTSKLMVAFKEVEGMITGSKYMMEGFKEYELKIGSIQTIAANTGALSKLNNGLKESIEYTEEEIDVVNDVIRGLYSAGDERKKLLEEANYDYEKIQNKVNQIMAGIDDNTTEIGNKTVTTLADIDAALDDLNVYADKTIYSFSQMTAAIGRFTTAGIDLETSTETVKALSNLAALSGATNNNLQSAMYNFSQAMQKGSMQLIDWRSIENANMASATFKEAIMDTARVHGIAIDEMIAENGNFNETLKKGWLTNDIMIESLAKLTAFAEDMTEEEREAERERWKEIGYTEQQIAEIEDLSRVAYEAATKVRTFSQLVDTTKEEIGSSYTMMWQNIIGNFDEATDLWTSIHDAIQDHFITPMTKAREEKWKFFHDNGGRAAAIEGLTNVGKGLLTIIHAITDAWHEVFPPDDGHRITEIAKAFAEFSKKLIVSEETAEKIKMTFKGLFSVLHIFVTTAKIGIKVIATLIKAIMSLSAGSHPILELTSRIGSLIVQLDEFISDSANVERAVDAIVDVLKRLWSVFEPLVDDINEMFAMGLAPKIQKIFSDLRSYIRGFVKGSSDDVNSIENEDTSGVESFGEKVKNAIGPVLEKLEPVLKIGKKIAELYIKFWKFVIGWGKEAIVRIGELMSDASEGITISGLIEAIMGAQLFMMLRSIQKFFNQAQKSLGNIQQTLGKVNAVLDGVHDVLEAYVLDIKANVLIKIATAVLMLCGALIALSFIDANKLWQAVGAMTALMAELAIFTLLMSKVLTGGLELDTKFAKGSFSTIGPTIMMLATSMLLLSGAVFILSKIDGKRIAVGLTNMIYILAITIGAIFGLSKVVGKEMQKEIMSAAFAMIEMAIALTLMIVPVTILSFLPADRVAKGMFNIAKMLLMLILSLSAISVTMRLLRTTSKQLMSAAFAMIEMATAINMLLIPIMILGLLPDKMLEKGMIAVVSLMAVMTVAVMGLAVAMKKVLPSDIMAAALAMMEIATAINMLALPIIILGLTPYDTLVQGGKALVTMLIAIGAFLYLMPKDSAKMGATLTALALNMLTIATALYMLSPIDGDKLLKTAGSLGIILITMAALMSQITPTNNTVKVLQYMSVMIAVLATSLYALSKIPFEDLMGAVGAMGLFIGIFVVLGAVVGKFQNIAAGLYSISSAMISFGSMIALIGAGFLAITSAIWVLSKVDYDNIKLGKLGKELASFITELLVGLTKGLAEVLATIAAFAPLFGAYLFRALIGVLRVVADNIGELINVLVTIVCKIADGIGDNALEIFDHLMGGLIKIFDAISTWLTKDNNYQKLAESFTNFIVSLTATLIALCGELVKVGWEIVSNIFYGIFNWYEGTGVYGYLHDIGSGLFDAVTKIKEWISQVVHEEIDWSDIGKAIITLIINGMNPSSLIGGTIFKKLSNMIHSKAEDPNGKEYSAFGGTSAEDEMAIIEKTRNTYKAIEKATSVFGKTSSKMLNLIGGNNFEAYLEGFNGEARIESPSKVMEESGNYLMQGLGIGIEDGENGVLSKIKGFMNDFSSKVSGTDLTATMGITPVVDMDRMQNDMMNQMNVGDIGTMSLDGSTVSLDNTDFTNKMSMDISDSMNSSQEELVNKTSAIYDELASLRGYISEIKIQLDSGALVGSLVGPMDTALGERQNMKARGV
jgi:tape measure domain-containing protein